MQATLLFALLLFWVFLADFLTDSFFQTAHALTINLTSEGLRNDEWWSIACVYNTLELLFYSFSNLFRSHFTGKFLSSIYSHESEVLWFYFVNANPDSQKGQLIDIRTNTNNTLTKPLTSTPLPDGTYQFRFAFKQNGSLFTVTYTGEY